MQKNWRLIRIATILATGMLFLNSCSFQVSNPVAPLPSDSMQKPSNNNPVSPLQPEDALPASQEVSPQEGEPPIDKTWISPGKVNVGNFYSGARAEWPLLIHNGSNGQRTESISVSTEVNETRVAVPLRGFPVDTNSNSFLVTSSTDNSLSPVSYSVVDHTLLVEGFKSNATTVISVSYVSKSQFSVYYREPDHLLEGYENAPFEAKNWVIIADKSPVIMPQTTQEIMIALDIPEDYAKELPDKWEFWIGVVDISQEGMIQAELCSRWLIISRAEV